MRLTMMMIWRGSSGHIRFANKVTSLKPMLLLLLMMMMRTMISRTLALRSGFNRTRWWTLIHTGRFRSARVGWLRLTSALLIAKSRVMVVVLVEMGVMWTTLMMTDSYDSLLRDYYRCIGGGVFWIDVVLFRQSLDLLGLLD